MVQVKDRIEACSSNTSYLKQRYAWERRLTRYTGIAHMAVPTDITDDAPHQLKATKGGENHSLMNSIMNTLQAAARSAARHRVVAELVPSANLREKVIRISGDVLLGRTEHSGAQYGYLSS